MRVSQSDLSRMLLAMQLQSEVKLLGSDSHITDKGSRYISGLHKSWASLVDGGNNLIVDYHFQSEDVWEDFIANMCETSLVIITTPGSRQFNPSLPAKQVIHDIVDADTIARRLALLKLI